MVWLMWVWTAWAADVPEQVRPAVAPPDLPARYAAWAASKDRPGVSLACDTVVEDEVLLCFRLRDEAKGTRRWVDSEDLTRWGVDVAGLRAVVRQRATEPVSTSGETVSVGGLDASYLRLAEGDGWSAAVLLHPDRVAQRLGVAVPTLRVGVPNVGVSLAWGGGRPDVDLAMAVGAVEMHGTQAQAVSSAVLRWTDGAWRVHARAVPEDATSEGAVPAGEDPAPEGKVPAR